MDPRSAVVDAVRSARYGEAAIVSVSSASPEERDGSAAAARRSSREIVLVAALDEENGGVVWRDAAVAFSASAEPPSPATTSPAPPPPPPLDVGIVRHLRTKRWVLPMLNDDRRGMLYDEAIRRACREAASSSSASTSASADAAEDGTASASGGGGDDDDGGGGLRVLDIGSGTGLLAMMAARHAADALREIGSREGGGERARNAGGTSADEPPAAAAAAAPPPPKAKVTTVETASAMARLAELTMASNFLDDVVDVVEGHSRDPSFRLSRRADVCTSELVESGLLGEGVLPTMRDAWDRHLRAGAAVVPRGARVHAQVLEGREMVGHFRGPTVRDGGDGDGGVRLCASSDRRDVLLGGRAGEEEGRGVGGGVLVPVRAEADHWHQCLFVFGADHDRCPRLTEGEAFELIASHDDSRIRFSVRPGAESSRGANRRGKRRKGEEDGSPPDAPVPDGRHDVVRRLISPERALQLNDDRRSSLLRSAVETAVRIKGRDGASVLDLSDFSLCALFAAVAGGARRVTSLESSAGDLPLVSARVAQLGNALPRDGCQFEVLKARAEDATAERLCGGEAADVTAAEPYYEILEGWHLQKALNYFYLLRALKRRGAVRPLAISVPTRAWVMGCAVQLDGDFAAAYGRIGARGEDAGDDNDNGDGDGRGGRGPFVRGFDHSDAARHGLRYHEYDAAFPLWQYEGHARLTRPFEVARIEYEGDADAMSVGGANGMWVREKFVRPGTCHALVCWVEYGMRVLEEGEDDDGGDGGGGEEADGGGPESETDLLRRCSERRLSTFTRGHRQAMRMMAKPEVVDGDDFERCAFCCRGTFGGLSGGEGGVEDHDFDLRVERY